MQTLWPFDVEHRIGQSLQKLTACWLLMKMYRAVQQPILYSTC
ncbi:MAG: hypothetical protein R2795_02760 [Saprospiraceae bacterium]